MVQFSPGFPGFLPCTKTSTVSKFQVDLNYRQPLSGYIAINPLISNIKLQINSPFLLQLVTYSRNRENFLIYQWNSWLLREQRNRSDLAKDICCQEQNLSPLWYINGSLTFTRQFCVIISLYRKSAPKYIFLHISKRKFQRVRHTF